MKKLITGILIGIILGSMGAYAASEIIATQASYPVIVNGNKFTSSNPVLNVNGTTYLPLRDTANALGTKIAWNNDLKRVEIGMMPNIKPKKTDNNVTLSFDNIKRATPDQYVGRFNNEGCIFVVGDLSVTNNETEPIEFKMSDVSFNYKIKNSSGLWNEIKGKHPDGIFKDGSSINKALEQYAPIQPGETRVINDVTVEISKWDTEYVSVLWKYGHEFKQYDLTGIK